MAGEPPRPNICSEPMPCRWVACCCAAGKVRCFRLKKNTYPYQNKLAQPLRQIAKLQQNAGLINIWRGQSSPQFSEASTKEILLGLSADIDSFPTNENQ